MKDNYMDHYGEPLPDEEFPDVGFRGFRLRTIYSASGFPTHYLMPEDIDFITQIVNGREKQERHDNIHELLTNFSHLLKRYNLAVVAGHFLEQDLLITKGKVRKEERLRTKLENEKFSLRLDNKELKSKLNFEISMHERYKGNCEYFKQELNRADDKIASLEKEVAELKAKLGEKEKGEEATKEERTGKWVARIQAQRGGLQRAERMNAMPTEIEHVYKFNTPPKGQGK